MPTVSLTTFIDFVAKAGTPKVTVVRNWKARDYSLLTDFYKQLRDAIADLHRQAKPGPALDELLSELTDKKKMANYPAAVHGYRKWLGKRQMAWFEPVSGNWQYAGLKVNVNPELGLTIKGAPHLIKLYLKADELAKNRVDAITHLMGLACGKAAPKGCTMGVLDVRRAHLITPTVPIPGLDSLLRGEAAAWMAIWPDV